MERLLDFIRHVFYFSQEARRHGEDIEKLEERMDEVMEALQHLAHENQRLRDFIEFKLEKINDEHEKQNLRIENQFLKFEKILPAPPKEKQEQ